MIQFLDPKVNPEGGPQMSKKIIGFGGRKCAFLARFPVTPSALALLHPMEFREKSRSVVFFWAGIMHFFREKRF